MEEEQTYIINGYKIDFPNQFYLSNNSDYLIYSKSDIGKASDIWLYQYSTEQESQITDNALWIEYSPVVNDYGEWAYIQYEENMDESYIITSSARIDLPEEKTKGSYICLEIVEQFLFTVYKDSSGVYLYCYTLQGNEVANYPIDIYVSRMIYVKQDHKLLLEGYNYRKKVGSMDVFCYDFKKETIEAVAVSNEDELVLQNESGQYMIGELKSSNNANILFNTLYYLYRFQYMNPYAHGGDFSGRIAWNQVNRVLGMLELNEKCPDLELTDKLKQSIKAMLKTSNKYMRINAPYVSDSLWIQKRYSFDRNTLVSTFVENSRIVYAMLAVAEAGLLDDSINLKGEAIQMGQNLYEYFSDEWNDSLNMYVSSETLPITYSGIPYPFNQQCMFGMAMIKLYKCTGDERYKERAFQLADSFRSNWEWTEHNSVIWTYWQKDYLEGYRIEDVSHGAICIGFVFEFMDAFKEQRIFDNKDIDGLRQTLSLLLTNDKKYSYRIDGSGAYSANYYPKSYWLLLNDEKLRPLFSHLGTFSAPDFDSQGLFFSYAQAFDPFDEEPLKLLLWNYDEGRYSNNTAEYIIPQSEINTFVINYFSMLNRLTFNTDEAEIN